MQKAVLYGVIAAIVLAAGVGIAFAAISMNNADEPAVASQQQNTNNNDVRVIQHAIGETVITGTPERVVALHWIYAEDLLALEIQPAGVVFRDDFEQFVADHTSLRLLPDVKDVGTTAEPNLEAILELEPDLIISWNTRQGELYEELSER